MQEGYAFKNQNQNSNAATARPKKHQNRKNLKFGRDIQNRMTRKSFVTPVKKAARLFFNLTPKVMEKKVRTLDSATSTCHYVNEHRDKIFDFLKFKENAHRKTRDLFAGQADVTPKMRAILVDWLVDISLRFKLLPETLFLAIGTIDRVLERITIERDKLQLLGVASLFAAAKFEEIYPPRLKDYVALCDNSYSKQDIVSMEGLILTTLNFNLTQPSSFSYLRLFNSQLNINSNFFLFAQYLLETALADIACLKHNQSTLAASAIFLVYKIFKKEDWAQKYIDLTNESEDNVKRCAKDLYVALQRAETSELTAIRRKFSHQDYLEVGQYKIHQASNRN